MDIQEAEQFTPLVADIIEANPSIVWFVEEAIKDEELSVGDIGLLIYCAANAASTGAADILQVSEGALGVNANYYEHGAWLEEGRRLAGDSNRAKSLLAGALGSLMRTELNTRQLLLLQDRT